MTKLSTNASIQASYADEEPTMLQAKWLIGLYRETLQKKILKRHSRLQNAKTSAFPFFNGSGRKPGSFAIHFLNTFSVDNNISRGATSTMINNALPVDHPKKDGDQQIFDAKFVSAFLDSSNTWYENRDKESQTNS
tara:strand:- start:367 stop:774 length:408 start_codon:yes stop_codon:yes gene_type:complete